MDVNVDGLVVETLSHLGEHIKQSELESKPLLFKDRPLGVLKKGRVRQLLFSSSSSFFDLSYFVPCKQSSFLFHSEQVAVDRIVFPRSRVVVELVLTLGSLKLEVEIRVRAGAPARLQLQQSRFKIRYGMNLPVLAVFAEDASGANTG